MPLNEGWNSFFTLALEASYMTTPGPVSSIFPITEGNDGLQRSVEHRSRNEISGRGDSPSVQVRDACGGHIGHDFAWDQIGRYFAALTGTKLSTGASAPIDNYYFPTAQPRSLQAVVYRDQVKWTYKGLTPSSLVLDLSGGDVMTLRSEFLGGTSTPAANSTAYIAASYLPVKTGYLTTLTFGAITGLAALIRNPKFTFTNVDLDGNTWPAGLATRGQPYRRGPARLEMSFQMDWSDEYYAIAGPTGLLHHWHTDTPGALMVILHNGLATIYERKLMIYAPVVKIMGEPPETKSKGPTEVTINMQSHDGTIAAGAMLGENGGSNAEQTHCPYGVLICADEESDSF